MIKNYITFDFGESFFRDQKVIDRIASIYENQGSDCWFTDDSKVFLGDEYNPNDYEKLNDIVEVWFDSGSTHSFVLEKRKDLKWPADMYLEGSDQHRGWFHSSLLESCGTRGRAVYYLMDSWLMAKA